MTKILQAGASGCEKGFVQGGPTEFYSGNWSILYAVWEISIYFYYDINTYQWRS